MLAPPGAGHGPEVEGVQGDLHQGVGEASGQRAMIADPGGFGQGEDGGLEGGGGDGIEVATQGQEPPFTGDELAAVALGGTDRLGEDRGGVMGVASLGAVGDEAAHRVFPGELQEGALVEGERRRDSCGIGGSAGSESADGSARSDPASSAQRVATVTRLSR